MVIPDMFAIKNEDLLTPPSDVSVPPAYFKSRILLSLTTLFGEVGNSSPIDILKYYESDRRAILRCPTSSYVKLRSALTLTGAYQGVICAFRVHNTSPSLLALLGDSRAYVHACSS